MVKSNLPVLASIAFLMCVITPASAAPITELERRQCQADYHQFCGDYGLDSPTLRTCMNKHGHNLSHGCVEALIDAGEVTRAEVERRKRTGE
jgi:hypothetical protein